MPSPRRHDLPVQAIMGVPGLERQQARRLAIEATRQAARFAPRSSGTMARGIHPVWGQGWFGLYWQHDYLWFQEIGTEPHTMRNLAGKTIPMWVRDPDGSILRKNPKAKTRIREDDGSTEVLIFRRAAKIGQRKKVWRQVGGHMERVDVPASYPGAPGRIAVNRNQGIMRNADVIGPHRNRGQIARGNVGVRWRHPGLQPGRFLARGIQTAASSYGLPLEKITYLTRADVWANNYQVLVGAP